jgi:hypothetical protein
MTLARGAFVRRPWLTLDLDYGGAPTHSRPSLRPCEAISTQAADAYTVLSQAVVLATVSPDLIGDVSQRDAKAFAKCFRAQRLTERDLRATLQARKPGPRVTRCLDKLIGL